jgi:hypothetical protein
MNVSLRENNEDATLWSFGTLAAERAAMLPAHNPGSANVIAIVRPRSAPWHESKFSSIC